MSLRRKIEEYMMSWRQKEVRIVELFHRHLLSTHYIAVSTLYTDSIKMG